MPAKDRFVHRNVTVIVGNDEEAGVTVIFVVKRTGGIAFSFPMESGASKELTADEMELFLRTAPSSEMLDTIQDEWTKARLLTDIFKASEKEQ